MQRWAEDSGNAALMGRELPPAEVLAADQRITAWARELRAAGLDGDMDVLRARAYLDILLDKDSRPRQDSGGDAARGQRRPGQRRPGQRRPGQRRPGQQRRRAGTREAGRPDGPGGPPGTSTVPAGFAGRINLTVPLATLLDLAERPGEIPGIGPIDPWLARDLAGAAARPPQDDVVRDRDR